MSDTLCSHNSCCILSIHFQHTLNMCVAVIPGKAESSSRLFG